MREEEIHNEMENTSCEEPTTIPPDIITEILSFTPAESLQKFKCICRKWESVIQDKEFIAQHLLRGGSVVYMNPRKQGPTQETFDCISSVAGLLLEKNKVSNNFRIRNPKTHQVLDLPARPDANGTFTLAYISSTSQFKVICIYEKEDNTTKCDVLILGNNEPSLWNTHSIPYKCVNRAIEGIYVLHAGEAVVHYVKTGTLSADTFEMITIDLKEECFTFNTLRQSFFIDMSEVWMFIWRDSLAFSDIVKDKQEVKLLEDYAKHHQWSGSKIEVPLTLLKENPDALSELDYISVENSFFTFWLNKNNVLQYSLKDYEVKGTFCLLEGFEFSNEFQKTLVTFQGI